MNAPLRIVFVLLACWCVALAVPARASNASVGLQRPGCADAAHVAVHARFESDVGPLDIAYDARTYVVGGDVLRTTASWVLEESTGERRQSSGRERFSRAYACGRGAAAIAPRSLGVAYDKNSRTFVLESGGDAQFHLRVRDGARPAPTPLGWAETRASADGAVFVNDAWHTVRGNAWLDVERIPPPGDAIAQADRYEISLEGGIDAQILVWHDPKTGRHSGGTVVTGGHAAPLPDGVPPIVPWHNSTWRSPTTDLLYPDLWTLSVGGRGGIVDPRISDQEFVFSRSSVRVWDGAVTITSATRQSSRTIGYGFAQLAPK